MFREVKVSPSLGLEVFLGIKVSKSIEELTLLSGEHIRSCLVYTFSEKIRLLVPHVYMPRASYINDPVPCTILHNVSCCSLCYSLQS